MESHDSLSCCPDQSVQVWNLRCPRKSRPPMEEFVNTLRNAGGVMNAAAAEQNLDFFAMIHTYLPELEIYTQGSVQTSPGIIETPGSYTEYFRTTGAIIALIAAFASSQGDSFGLEAVSSGSRGLMSIDAVPGKFVNMGNQASAYASFCDKFASFLSTDDDWWAMLVLLAVHDLGKCDEFCSRVNSSLSEDLRTDDHDMVLAHALCDPSLTAELLPSVHALSSKHQKVLCMGFRTGFQLPQLGQGEMALSALQGLLDLPRQFIESGSLALYFYHSIFDVAGSTSSKEFIYPLAVQPVYVGFCESMFQLCSKLIQNDLEPSKANHADLASTQIDDCSLYFDFLYVNFKSAYPEFEDDVFRTLCRCDSFRRGLGLAFLRILALTRNTYRNPAALLTVLRMDVYKSLVEELSGSNSKVSKQIMLYYGPDMFRMGLGTGRALDDEDGKNMQLALHSLGGLYRLARRAIGEDDSVRNNDAILQVNVRAAVRVIKSKGKQWGGGYDLHMLLRRARIEKVAFATGAVLHLDADIWNELN
eukprot:TRINITY_DN23725_c0_g2_i1.p1 TRINITY_DN23725_c0_g2~~TRINITY_DN23725_c0_g2_i1.p1  ORF type:complete len:532 (+),score=78.20 TRINITY_DN23725_c0_g2_i1:73-1668(+)